MHATFTGEVPASASERGVFFEIRRRPGMQSAGGPRREATVLDANDGARNSVQAAACFVIGSSRRDRHLALELVAGANDCRVTIELSTQKLGDVDAAFRERVNDDASGAQARAFTATLVR